MAKTASFKRTVSLDSVSLTSSESVTYDTSSYFKQTVAASQTDLNYIFPIKYTGKLKFIYLLASVDMLVEFGSSAGAQGSATLKAGVPKICTYSGSGGSNSTNLEPEIVTGDVTVATGIYVTTTTSGQLEIAVGYNN